MTMFASLRGQANRLLRRFGFQLVRLHEIPGGLRANMIRHHDIQTVVDVGGNVGAYGAELRDYGYTGKIISFEPTSEAFAVLAERAKADPLWTVIKCAIGEAEGEVTINVAANAAASSSILPMLDRHLRSAPDSAYVSSEKVALKTLDQVLHAIVRPSEKIFLKIDTQGYEGMVLKGATQTLQQVELMECELSFVRLYEGQLLFSEMHSLLKSLGFSPVQFSPGFLDPLTGHNLQVDGIFSKSADA